MHKKTETNNLEVCVNEIYAMAHQNSLINISDIYYKIVKLALLYTEANNRINHSFIKNIIKDLANIISSDNYSELRRLAKNSLETFATALAQKSKIIRQPGLKALYEDELFSSYDQLFAISALCT